MAVELTLITVELDEGEGELLAVVEEYVDEKSADVCVEVGADVGTVENTWTDETDENVEVEKKAEEVESDGGTLLVRPRLFAMEDSAKKDVFQN